MSDKYVHQGFLLDIESGVGVKLSRIPITLFYHVICDVRAVFFVSVQALKLY